MGVKRGRCIRLTTSLPSVSQLSTQCGVLNISQPYRPSRPVAGIAVPFYNTNSSICLSTSQQFCSMCLAPSSLHNKQHTISRSPAIHSYSPISCAALPYSLFISQQHIKELGKYLCLYLNLNYLLLHDYTFLQLIHGADLSWKVYMFLPVQESHHLQYPYATMSVTHLTTASVTKLALPNLY
jgi:hypothetical protein